MKMCVMVQEPKRMPFAVDDADLERQLFQTSHE